MSLAARGTRKLVEGPEEKIENLEELAQVRRQAGVVRMKSILAAIPLTLIAVVLPMLR